MRLVADNEKQEGEERGMPEKKMTVAVAVLAGAFTAAGNTTRTAHIDIQASGFMLIVK